MGYSSTNKRATPTSFSAANTCPVQVQYITNIPKIHEAQKVEQHYFEEINPDITYEQILSLKELNHALKNGLLSLYTEIFAEPPHYEKFTDESVISLFEYYHRTGRVFLAKKEREIVGFATSVPLSDKPDIINLAKCFIENVHNYWYIAEIGVKKSCRRQGIAKHLTIKEMLHIPSGAALLVRMIETNMPSIKLHEFLGFAEVPNMKQTMKHERICENIPETDTRIFLEFKKQR